MFCSSIHIFPFSLFVSHYKRKNAFFFLLVVLLDVKSFEKISDCSQEHGLLRGQTGSCLHSGVQLHKENQESQFFGGMTFVPAFQLKTSFFFFPPPWAIKKKVVEDPNKSNPQLYLTHAPNGGI